ncbi:uncharacterized protein LOC111278406 isoform X2 [Durio zibethinus]|uniref:Uncharacterized protein LOC111278406 isoform X2 n=1 Tax=Durio zibethinus TaxID=66656 RepID=A0A6P5WXH1_DURZI|nr:uncharacterized protein LOC111278406 isoform X2 [Durio zibethinus]
MTSPEYALKAPNRPVIFPQQRPKTGPFPENYKYLSHSLSFAFRPKISNSPLHFHFSRNHVCLSQTLPFLLLSSQFLHSPALSLLPTPSFFPLLTNCASVFLSLETSSFLLVFDRVRSSFFFRWFGWWGVWMDAVELNYLADVSKLMGSEGFGRGARVSEDYETGIFNALDSTSWSKIPDVELCRHASQLPRSQMEELSEQHDQRGTTCPLPNPGPDVVNAQRKVGKMPRSGSGCSKRARVGQLEDIMTSVGIDDVKDINDNFPDKTQMSRQKNSVNGKRGDRRNFKVPMKPKFDSFSMKVGLVSFTMASGGNNFLGYGLKSDINDVTKLVEDLSLNGLLDGTYEYPILGKEKGRKAANTTENFLHSVKKACSILPLRRVQSQNFTDIDDSSNKKMPMYPLSSVSGVAGCINCDKEDTCSKDPSPCNKVHFEQKSNMLDPRKTQDSCGNPEMPASPPDFPLCQPKDILERLALPPPKDLDSLLLAATKPSSSTRNNSDTRSGKQISCRAILPPFPWSHTFNGCRTNPDVAKLLSNKSTCQGRWVKIPNTSRSPGIATGCFTNLESLAYDPSLIPSGSKLGNLEGGIASSTGNLCFCEQGASSLATYTKAFNVPHESGLGLADQWNVGHCPRLLAAAQTLYDIATKSLRQNPDGITRWPKKPSQKAMKARKIKSIEKPEEIYATPSSVLGSDKLVRSDMDQIVPSKRPKLSVVEKKKDLSRINGVSKGPIARSTPRSSRSSPGKSLRDSIVEIRYSTANVVKAGCTMRPPATVLDKPCNSKHKLRKLMPVNWKRG